MTISEKIEVLKKYIEIKIDGRDWHAVSDAANDIRELEAVMPYEHFDNLVHGPDTGTINHPIGYEFPVHITSSGINYDGIDRKWPRWGGK